MSAPSIDNLVDRFENPSIPPIDGKPTYATLHAMHKLLNSNMASVTTNLGCGTLRHLCLTLSPTVYAALLTTRDVVPPNPRATPVIPQAPPDLKQRPSATRTTRPGWNHNFPYPGRSLWRLVVVRPCQFPKNVRSMRRTGH